MPREGWHAVRLETSKEGVGTVAALSTMEANRRKQAVQAQKVMEPI